MTRGRLFARRLIRLAALVSATVMGAIVLLLAVTNSAKASQSGSVASANPHFTLSVGDSRACVIVAGGRVKCWGDGIKRATAVPGITHAVSVSAGTGYTCAVIAGGAVKCWGSNSEGQLGNRSTKPSRIPVTVLGIHNAVAVSAGHGATCVLLARGTVKCWGTNFGHAEGNLAVSFVPVSIRGIRHATLISDSIWYHWCTVIAGGAARCWGYNDGGGLGNGTETDPPKTTSVAVRDLSKAIGVTTGEDFSCALVAGGSVKCWGRGAAPGVLPFDVQGVERAVAVDAGIDHICALVAGGTVECWGDGSYGQLGAGTRVKGYVKSPVRVTQIGKVVSVSAGTDYTCALLAAGGVMCWGANDNGELGNGTTKDSAVPVSVVGLA